MKAPCPPAYRPLTGPAKTRGTGPRISKRERERYPIPPWRRVARASRPHRFLLYIFPMLASAGCTIQGQGFLSPEGPIASTERQLFFEVTALTLIAVVPVLVLTPWLVWRYRRGNEKAAYRPKWDFSCSLEVLAWGVPIMIVSVLGYMLWERTQQLDPYRPLVSDQPPLEVRVVGLDWKWLFISR